MRDLPAAQASSSRPPAHASGGDVELTILIPCLNEAESLAFCVQAALSYLRRSRIRGEVLVADNGSSDGSVGIATREGARVIHAPIRGYGGAVSAGIAAARGTYTIMGDGDGSYDFEHLDAFIDRLRAGADLVMGNRFAGGIESGAMPRSHRYLGNPVLSFIGRLLFSTSIGDFHCGLRGFRTERIRELQLATAGMEFASEMVVRAAIAGYRLEGVPTTLSRDRRSRPPHLNTWRDGWRHLRFLLLFSPRWLFIYPGIVLVAIGALMAGLLFSGPLVLGTVTLDIHTFVAACMLVLIGTLSLSFGATVRRFATRRGLLPTAAKYDLALRAMTMEVMLVAGIALALVGALGAVWCVGQWASNNFGAIGDARILRVLVLSFTAFTAGLQLGLTGLLAGAIEALEVSTPAPAPRRSEGAQTVAEGAPRPSA